ncbi:MAG: pitrilysin family protein [Oscillospiraceae bacterium]|nr:pitrilysin family protein [Oscillospiraceae bacterium]
MHQKIVLPNGVRILTEYIPYVRSAAVGIWVGSGSRHERPEQQGISHFIEHMVFKGTEQRTAMEQAMLMDSIGGQFNAFTSKEYTCYYAWTLDTHLRQALDVLCDLFFHAKFDPSDVEVERGVILEEIGMCEDTPEDLCLERLVSAAYKGNALSHPILGIPSSLSKLTGRRLSAYRKKNYLPQQTVVSLSGSFSDSDIAYLSEWFSQMEPGIRKEPDQAVYLPSVTVCRKEIEQNHICIAFPGLPYGSPKRFAMQLLNSILGGGMSSRIFQEVRERLGLCYNIYSFGAGHTDTGLLCIYTALGRETEDRAILEILRLARKFAAEGVTDEELVRAREQSKANVFLSMESTISRMNHLARSELFYGFIPTAEEIISGYDAVTREEIMQLAAEIFDFEQLSLSAVGKTGTSAHYRKLLRSV